MGYISMEELFAEDENYKKLLNISEKKKQCPEYTYVLGILLPENYEGVQLLIELLSVSTLVIFYVQVT